MVIKDALVFDGYSGFLKRDIHICGDRIVSDYASDTTIDAYGLYATYGLTDTHFHGCNGYDICDTNEAALREIARYELDCGVTQICPATMAIHFDELIKVLQTYASYTRKAASPMDGSTLVGLNIEGSFISPQRCGAHQVKGILPLSIDIFDNMQSVSDSCIKLVTVAPERKDAVSFISCIAKKGVRVAIGHTNADYEEALLAFRSGASHVTHLFNAMPPFLHRAPSVIGAAFDSAATVEIISDGVHVSPSAVRAAFRLFGNDIVLISDSMRAAGMPDGTYTLGGNEAVKSGREVRNNDGTLAGSATSLLDCMRCAVSMGIPLVSALRAATVTPIRVLGIDDEYGSIDIGKYANILLLDRELNLRYVIHRGKLARRYL